MKCSPFYINLLTYINNIITFFDIAIAQVWFMQPCLGEIVSQEASQYVVSYNISAPFPVMFPEAEM